MWRRGEAEAGKSRYVGRGGRVEKICGVRGGRGQKMCAIEEDGERRYVIGM